MNTLTLIALVISLFVLYLFVRWFFNKKKLLNLGLQFHFDSYPIIGSLPVLKAYNKKDYGVCEIMNEGFENLDKDIFAFDFGFGRNIVFLRDVDDIGAMLKSSLRARGFLSNITAAIGFEGSFNLNGERWHNHRKISVPALKKSTIRDVSWIFEECCATFFEVVKRNNSVLHVTDLVEKFTFDVIGLLAFGTHFHALENEHNEILESFKTSFGYFPKFSSNPLLKLWTNYVSKPADLKKAHDTLQSQSRRIVEEKIKKLETNEINSRPDLTDVLLSKLEKIDTEGVIGEVSLFLVAGSETTSNTLSYLIYALGMNPEIQNTMLSEINSIIGDRNIEFDDIEKLTYTDNCVKEALRLSSVAGIVGRSLEEPLEVQGIKLPAGTDLAFSNYHTMKNPEVWGENSDEFVPERFDSLSDQQLKSFLPFGAGKRICIGKNLAQIEMIWLIVSIIQKYHILPETPSVWPLPLKLTFTVTPKDQIYVQLVERK